MLLAAPLGQFVLEILVVFSLLANTDVDPASGKELLEPGGQENVCEDGHHDASSAKTLTGDSNKRGNTSALDRTKERKTETVVHDLH